MRILIADALPDAARLELQAAGLEVHVDPRLDGPTLAAAIAELAPEVLVVRSTKVKADALAASPALQLVVRARAGVNTIDLPAASARGIFVTNCPGTNAVATAELAFAHLLNADRRLADATADLRAGSWQKSKYSKGFGLKSRTLGVLGTGDIGKAVIARALAFEMNVIAWSPSLTPARAAALGVTRADSPVEVARAADALTVHLALTPATRGFVGPALFDALRPGALFINTSRGEVVDEAALAQAVEQKGIRVGLDVFADEPAADGEWRGAVMALPGVYGTPHVGASTAQAQEAVASETCAIILEWARQGTVKNCVNLAASTPATHLLVVRHVDQVGVLAGILGLLREAQINVQQMENIVFSGARAACARIQLEGAPSDAVLAALAEDAAIFEVKLVELVG
ncbi:MAG: NAD(P)-dependent oxidoreductase [bacterium]